MVAVSNPSVLDESLTDKNDRVIVHAYGAGNEPYELWERFLGEKGGEEMNPSLIRSGYTSSEYEETKEEAAGYLYESVSRALGIDLQEVRERSEVNLIGTPLTHGRYLKRYRGTYGPIFADTLAGPLTPVPGLFLVGDSTFPGIGVPAVAVSGANCANSMINVVSHIADMMA